MNSVTNKEVEINDALLDVDSKNIVVPIQDSALSRYSTRMQVVD